MRNMWKRSLSLVLAIVMIVGMLPMNVFATEEELCAHESVENQVCLICGAVLAEESAEEPAAEEPAEEPEAEEPAEEPEAEEPAEEPEAEEPAEEPEAEEPAEEPEAEEPAEEPEAEEPAEEIQQEESEPVVLEAEPAAQNVEPEEFGIAWIDTSILEPDEGLSEMGEMMFWGGLVSSGTFRNAVLRALGWYTSSTAKSYNVYYENMNVADSMAFASEMQKEEGGKGQALADAIQNGENVLFEVVRNGESTWVEIAFKNLTDVNNIDFSTETIKSKGEPADLEAEVAAALKRIEIDDFTPAQIEEVATAKLKELKPASGYEWPEIGEESEPYGPLYQVQITEALQGTKVVTARGGWIVLEDANQQFEIKFTSDGTELDKFYVWEGESFSKNMIPAIPARDGYINKGWNQEIDLTPDKDVEYKVVWEKIPEYTVIFKSVHPITGVETELYNKVLRKGTKMPTVTVEPNIIEIEGSRDYWAWSSGNWTDADGRSPVTTVTKDVTYNAVWTLVEVQDDAPVTPPTPPKTKFEVTYHYYNFGTDTWESYTEETYTYKGVSGYVEKPASTNAKGLINYGWKTVAAGEEFQENGKIKYEYCNDENTFDFDKDTINGDIVLVEAVRRDLNNNNVPDGEYNEATQATDKFAVYHFYNASVSEDTGDYVVYAEKNANLTDYNEDVVDNQKAPAVEEGELFIGWSLREKTEENSDYVIYSLDPIIVADMNGNGVDDYCETVEFKIYVPGEEEPISYAEYDGTLGKITIDKAAPKAVSATARAVVDQYLVNTEAGSEIKVTANGASYAAKISIERTADGAVMAEDGVYDKYAAKTAKLKDDKADEINSCDLGKPDYIISIEFTSLEMKNDPAMDVHFGKYTLEEVFAAVADAQYNAANGDTLEMTYIAREGGRTETVDVEAVFEWFEDNYTSTMSNMLKTFIGERAYIGADNRHKIDIDLGAAIALPVDATAADVPFWAGEDLTEWPVKTAQDAANEVIADFLNRFDTAMHNGETFDLANELMGVMELAAAAVVNYAEIYPFGYDPNGAGSFTETVTLFYEDGKTHKTLDKTGIVIKMTDGRADAAVSAKNISVPYGSNVKAPAGLELGADFGTKPTANNYPKTSVFSRGSETVKPGRTTVNVSIYEEEAAISMDSFFYKEHVNTGKNPVASSKAELIQIIAGLDITAEDTDLDIVFRNPKDSNVTVKNVNPEVYVKLPTSLIAVKDTLVGLIEELEGMDKAPNLGAMTGGKLSHEQVMALLKSDLHDITKEYTWDDFASLLDVMVGFAVDDADSNPKLDRILDLIKNQTNLETTGEIRVFFTDDAYPKKPGAYANIAIAMDNNYLNGLFDLDEVAGEKAKLTLGKDYGIILISPVLVQPNKGIQLMHSEFEDAQNIYEMFSDDAAKGWQVYDKNGNDVTASTELFYYGFNNELAVHYDGNTEDEKDDGKILPTKPGIYYVSAICRDAENKVVGTDLAVLIIGMEKATIDVIGVEEFYEPGVEHKPVIVVENEKGEELYESGKAGLTIISGTVTKNEGATLKDLKAEVNIDFPAKLDNALAAAYEYVTGNELGKGGITAASMTQSDLIAALEWIVDKIEERTLNNKLAQWGLAPDILKDKVLDKLDQKLESPETKAVNTINKLIAKIDEFELDDNAEITFKNKKGYEENGIYLYYAMITDPNYFVDIRSATDPSAVVDAMTGIVIVKGDLIMDDQTVVYTGEGQMPVVTAENMAKAYGMFFMVYDEQKHSISFVLDNDLNAVRTKLEQYMTINGKTIGELFGAANEKIPELAELIMDGITEEAVARIPGLETSSYFQNAKDKLEARLAKHGASMLKVIENKLLSLSDVLDKDTELTFNVKPTEVGTYKVHAFSYGIAHEDATFIIRAQDYGHKVRYNVGLIEPWFLRINVRVYDKETKETIDYNTLSDYGAYAIRRSDLADPTKSKSDLTVEDIMQGVAYNKGVEAGITDADNHAVFRSFIKDEKTNEDMEYLTFRFREGIYTYEMSDPIVFVYWYKDASGMHYSPIAEVNLSTLIDECIAGGKGNYGALEIATYQEMSDLEEDVVHYRNIHGQGTVPEQKLYTVADSVLGAPVAQTENKFSTTQNITLIEPWGIRINLRIRNAEANETCDYNAFEDYGMIMYHSADGTGPASAEELLAMNDAYVYSKSHGNVTFDGDFYSSRYNENIFTYQLNSKLYFMGYYVENGVYHYSNVVQKSIYDITANNLADATGRFNDEEKAVYEEMLALCDAVTAYREDYFKNH